MTTSIFPTLTSGLLLTGLLLTAPIQALADNHGEKTPATDVEFSKDVKTYGRFVPEREDDFAWENDRVAFRIYGPSSNGKGQISGVDAWFKKVDYSVVDKWYAEHLSGKSYHEDQGEGLDIYHTGSSRGVGGTAIWINGMPYPAGRFDSWKVTNDSPKLFAFTVDYSWETPLGQITEQKNISIKLGEQFYHVTSQFTLNGKPMQLPVAIGLTTHDGKATTQYDLAQGWAATWEAFGEDHVGSGIYTDNADNINKVVIEEARTKDESHIWLVSKTDNNGKLKYSAGFAWTAANKVKNQEDWIKLLVNSASK